MKAIGKFDIRDLSSPYISPDMTIFQMYAKGVLCQSLDVDRADVGYGFNDLGDINIGSI